MALQDLTPQLRTRLSRVERAVGLFVILATVMLAAGFSYYVYHQGKNKGWFLTKLPYNTFLASAEGLRVGDPVKILGFPAGEITEITAMPPFYYAGEVYIGFTIKDPYYGYIWDDSQTKVTSDFLNKRSLEIVVGGASGRTNLHESYQFSDKARRVASGVYDDRTGNYETFTNGHKGYTLYANSAMPLTERLELVAQKVEDALPHILALTNQLANVLTNASRAVANLNATISEVRPLVSNANFTILSVQPTLTNLNTITAHLRDPKGSLGEWLIPTNLNAQLERTLADAQATLAAATNTMGKADSAIYNLDTNITYIVVDLGKSLDNLANLTSNLNSQVQANTNLVTAISDAIIHTDGLVQGLKKHWLLRSAFKEKKTNAPPAKATTPVKPKGRE